MAELVSDTYATALFETALENNLTDTVKEELNSLFAILTEQSEYAKILSSPIVGMKEKHQLVQSAFAGKICNYILNLILVLIDNNRFSLFFDVVRAFNKLCDKQQNILRATAFTAVALSSDMIEKLQTKLCGLSNKNVILANEVDKTLIGGIVLKYDNMEIDGSVKAQLDEIKKQVKEKTI